MQTRRLVANARSQAGMTLIEIMVALAALSIASLGAVSSLISTASLDGELRERQTAVRAVTRKMESLLAFDYGDDISNLVAYCNDPTNATFDVPGLVAPTTAQLTANSLSIAAVPMGDPQPVGTVTVDDSDPLRIVMTVRIAWVNRSNEVRVFSLPMTLTEVVTQ